MKRRGFLKSAGLGGVAPLVVPGSVLGKDGAVAPSERVTLGCIGVGGQGSGNMRSLMNDERVQVVSICDVDAGHRASGLAAAKLKEGDGTGDFREVVGRGDIDTVMIATPDHWHSLITVAAARAGKDIYCEKPLAASIGEGRFVSDLVKKEGRVLQCGTWRRSGQHTRLGCEWVRNGYIGELKEIEVGVPGKFAVSGGFTGLEKPEEVPVGFDYEMWTGPAAEAAYTAARCHFNFRWVAEYAPGYITDWGVHFIDVAQWGLGADETGPVSVEARNVVRRDAGIYDAPEGFELIYRYANGVKMRMFSTTDASTYGIKFIGTEGWVFTENQKLETGPKELRKKRIKEGDERLYFSNNHHRNFIDCVKSREATAAPVEVAHRSASACHIGAIAAELGGGVFGWDPEAERFVGEKAGVANGRLMREMRGDWELV
ncbi:MAG: Gfo/Idh/MocA family oxidoreductase [Verrucomicrobiales bacterium]|nr:Gfo/Idh/MocA family oxidoreductase [Verrucomicrobiales bacterium]